MSTRQPFGNVWRGWPRFPVRAVWTQSSNMVLPWQYLADETGKITCRNRPAQRKTKY